MADEEAVEPNSNNKASNVPGSAPIRLVIADTEPIFRVGMKKIFALEEDLRVIAQAEGLEQTFSSLTKFPTDILLFEAVMAPNPAEVVSELIARYPDLKVVLLVPDLTEEETVEYLRRGVRGIVTRNISPDLLIRCVRKIAAGETWLDNKGVNWVIEAYRAQAAQLTSPRTRARLNEKELLIISGVTQGLKNKDIAQEIGTTEQVVKNYLRKVYDKLGVSDRLELALYCMHHRLLEGLRKPGEGAPTEKVTSVSAGKS